MDIPKKDLIERFSALSDEELLRRIAAGTLTTLADEVARAELASRGIEAPAISEAAAGDLPTTTDETRRDEADLVTLLRTNDVLKANVLRSCLESEGVFAFLWGENLGVANIIFSAATGGMRLQVRSDQLVRAQEILAAFERGEYAIEDDEQPE